MNGRVRVGAVDDLEDGESTVVDLDDGSVGVFRVAGEFYAYENRCPHAGGPVCEGRVRNALVARRGGAGERLDRDYEGDPAVTCPWHGWTFDVATGTHVGDGSISLVPVDVTVEDGTLFLEP